MAGKNNKNKKQQDTKSEVKNDNGNISLVLKKLGISDLVDTNDKDSVINALCAGILSLIQKYESDKEERQKEEKKEDTEDVKKKMRRQEDFLDSQQQYAMKGAIILHSPHIPERGLYSIIKSPTELKEEKCNQNFHEHITSLVKRNYDIDIPRSETIAIHPLKAKGTAIIKLWDRTNDSAFQKLSSCLKTGSKAVNLESVKEGESEEERKQRVAGKVNLFMTFLLTKARGDLVRCLRGLKKEGKIVKFSSNANGDIFMQKDDKSARVRLTFDWKDDNSKTWTPSEVREHVGKEN